MANTFQFISKLSNTSGTIDFTNIPQTYNDLILIMHAQRNAAGTRGDLVFWTNNNTSANSYRWQGFNSVGSTANYYGYNSNQISIIDGISLTNSQNAMAAVYITIHNYNLSGNQKPFTYHVGTTSQNGVTESANCVGGGRIVSTSAITSLQLSTASNFSSKTFAWLYGIKNS